MAQITEKQLNILIERINKAAGTPLTYTDKSNEKFKSNVGHYHLDSGYGGWKLAQVDNEAGGIRVISEGGFLTKRELYNQLQMFLSGIEVNN